MNEWMDDGMETHDGSHITHEAPRNLYSHWPWKTHLLLFLGIWVYLGHSTIVSLANCCSFASRHKILKLKLARLAKLYRHRVKEKN